MKQFLPKSLHFTNAKPSSQSAAQEFANITNLLKNGRREEAWKAAHVFYKKRPDDPSVNFLIALMLAEGKQNSKALPHLERAVKFAPNNAEYLVALGTLYIKLGMIEHAPNVLHKAFSIDNKIYKAPIALANYYFRSGQGKRALPYYDAALSTAPPASRAFIHLGRADCLSSLGRLVEAEADIRLAMDEPLHRVKALIAIALLQKNDQTSAHAQQIRKELEQPGLTVEDRSLLLLCLGRLHENGRDYDNAFSNFTKSRALISSKFDINDFPLQVEDASGFLTREVFEKFKAFGHESAKPIFVVGMPRSGTTMTEQIIAAHSQAGGVGELTRITHMFRNLAGPRGLPHVLEKMTELGPERWKDIPLQYLNLLNTLAPDASRTVDKMPHNFLYLGFIHLCFPKAQIIHCKRNPLDNFISAFQHPLDTFHRYSYDQLAFGEYYVNYLRLMDHWKSVFPESIYESQYEMLTQNPETEVRKMLDFLGLPWEEACLNLNETQSSIRTFSRAEVRNRINTASISRWRNYEKHLSPIIDTFKQAGIQF